MAIVELENIEMKAKEYHEEPLTNLQVDQIHKIEQQLSHSSIDQPEHQENETGDVFKTKKAKNLIKGFSLAITYSATICGTGSLIGTSSNIVFKGYFETKHPNDQLNFLTFMLFSLPISIVLVLCAWLILCFMWLPKGSD